MLQRDRIDVYVQALAGGTPTMVYQGKVDCPNWSPDGAHIVAVSDQQAAVVINADGSGSRTLSPQLGECGTQFSPDGTRLASIAYDAQGNPDLVIADVADQLPAVTIAAPGNVGQPSWQRVP
jgi:Tol biopolymer transport system component